MNNKLFNTKTKKKVPPAVQPANNNLKAVANVSNKQVDPKRSAAAKKAWETIRKKKAEEAARKVAGKKQYRSIDDEGDYG